MGKSLGNAIFLCDDDDKIKDKVMSAITDPNKIRKDDPANPDICMVYYYHKLVNKSCANVCQECKNGSRGCVACKKELIESMINFLKPIREKRKYYEENPKMVDDILIKGNEKAKKIAEENMKKIRHALQIDYFEGDL